MSTSEPIGVVAPSDENRHEPAADPLWSESYYLDFVDEERGVGGYVRLALLPNQGRAWYWVCVTGPDRPLVTVIDHEVALPRGRSTEVRAEGLWADYTVETPGDHVTVGVEAFAVALDHPADSYGHMVGQRVPLGFDLEWETDGGTYPYPGVSRYEVPCRVHGEVLVGSESIEIDGWGQRDHSWGPRDWWSYSWSWTAGRLDDGTRFHGTQVELDGTFLYGTGYVQPRGGVMVATDQVHRSEVLGDHGFPTEATWQIGDLSLEVAPVSFAPVAIPSGDGRLSHFPRAWTRFTANDGRRGSGWTEWNQPQNG